VEHAFSSLGLHRVALSVFAFNERAIRAYARVGFTDEGRAREAIWRDGRWWDEIHMSVLEPEWRARRWEARAAADGRASAGAWAVGEAGRARNE
jgi:RimJ/RimL family protein N-acetyltransferase